MGSRSQIYIQFDKQGWNRVYDGVRRSYHYVQDENAKQGLIASYFQTNDSDAMISRAKHTMEWLKSQSRYLYNHECQLTAKRMMEANFDRKTINLSSDIVEEWKQYGEPNDFNDFVFNYGSNNNGQLYINVTKDGDIKYGFVHHDKDGHLDFNKVLDAQGYLNAELRDITLQYREEVKEACVENIQWIKDNATVMSVDELKKFIEYDYGVLHPQQERPKETVIVGPQEYTLEDLEKHLENDSISNHELAEIQAAVWKKYETLRTEFEKETGLDCDVIESGTELSETAEELLDNIDYLEELDEMSKDQMFAAVEKEIGTKQMSKLIETGIHSGQAFSVVEKFKECFLSDVDVNKEKETPVKEPKTLQGLLAGAKEQKESMKTNHEKPTSKSKGQEL